MRNHKLKAIGFDFDDVLFNFNDIAALYHNRLYGTNYKRKDIKSFDLEALWNCSREEVNRKIVQFYRSEEHHNTPPVDGAIRCINNLRKHHELFVITARPEELKGETTRWLDKHFPGVFNEIYFTGHYFQGDGRKVSKGEICSRLGIEIFVDDSLDNAYDIVRAGVEVLLFDTPWNQGKPWLPVTRVRSWKEVEDHINQRNLGK